MFAAISLLPVSNGPTRKSGLLLADGHLQARHANCSFPAAKNRICRPFHQDFDITAVISKFSVSLATGRSKSGARLYLITWTSPTSDATLSLDCGRSGHTRHFKDNEFMYKIARKSLAAYCQFPLCLSQSCIKFYLIIKTNIKIN